jgi:Ca2+-transporting ATPase
MAEPTRPDKKTLTASLAAAAVRSTDHRASLSGLHVITQIPAQPNEPERRAFHAASPEDVERYWSTSIEAGLTSGEAERRLVRLGPNKLAEAESPALWRRLLAQISDFTVLALLAAAALAAGLSIVAPEPGASFLARFGDSLAILLIVILNAILGLIQEKRAEDALRALRDMTAPNAHVRRDGKVVEAPSQNLVPGDVLHLEEGDMVAADMRLVAAADLEIEEAALTGESVPVSKDATLVLEPGVALADRMNMAFMGTRVSRGRARGIVCNTGMHTELGSIAGMLATVEEESTPLQEQLERFGRDIVIGCVAVSAIVFIAGWLLGGYHPREMFLVAVALAVAAIPEGLPAITTITLALGTSRMAKRNALVRRLASVETLGCAQLICTDKTGTLTQNAMAVRRLWTAGATYRVGGEARAIEGEIAPQANGDGATQARDLDRALHAAAFASGARLNKVEGEPTRVQVIGDPTDAALLILARKGKKHHAEGVIRGEVPFTSSRRMATVVVEESGRPVAYTRGAPEVILDLSERIHEDGAARPLTAEDRQLIADTAASWGKEAMRVVALAVREEVPTQPAQKEGDYSHWERGLTFVALVGIVDPPRPEVAEAIAKAARAGIRSVMITGDHPATARAIAQEIGLWADKDLVLTGAELDALDQQRLEGVVERVRVVARATAAHKLRIVEALKSRGLVCAMTGDGVNDAPAVKSAHIGIAMGKAGTEVTKEAADLVLADDNYATIVAAVEEGRAIYANIRKFIYFLLSSNAGIVLVVLVASLFGWHAPLTPIQILWINLITNGLPALALGVDPKDPDQMTQPPRVPGKRLMAGREWLSLMGVGAVMATASLWAFWYVGGASSPESLPHARALAFTVLSMSPMFHALNCRSQTRSIFQLGLFSNRPIWGAIAIGVALQSMALYVPALSPVFKTIPLPASDLLLVVGLASIPLFIGETIKVFLRARGATASAG